MGRFTLRPFDKADVFELIRQGVRDGDNFIGIGDVAESFAELHAKTGMGFTLVSEGKVIGCGGVEKVGDNGMAWFLVSTVIKQYKKTVLRVTRMTLDNIIKEEHLKIVYALVAAIDVPAQAWASILDFTYQPSVPKVKGPDGREYLTYRRAA
jgi:hypothetical protein